MKNLIRTGSDLILPTESALVIWRAVAGYDDPPDCLLVNFYREGAKMGLHRDADENAYDAPVVSVSLGDPARFRMGGLARTDGTEAVELLSVLSILQAKISVGHFDNKTTFSWSSTRVVTIEHARS